MVDRLLMLLVGLTTIYDIPFITMLNSSCITHIFKNKIRSVGPWILEPDVDGIKKNGDDACSFSAVIPYKISVILFINRSFQLTKYPLMIGLVQFLATKPTNKNDPF
jgi:hypothetical protein